MVKGTPDENKGDAHETVYLVLNRDDVPPNIVTGVSKGYTLGSFRNKFPETDCHIKYTETYSPWQLWAEGDIG